MRFWDASAVVPVCVDQPTSAGVKSILMGDTSVVVWWATRTECVSAFIRQARDGLLGDDGERQARQVLRGLGDVWAEVQPTEAVRSMAERLLAVHSLRAADAFQLAAALDWCEGQPRDMVFVSLDARLRGAADREGFIVHPLIETARSR